MATSNSLKKRGFNALWSTIRAISWPRPFLPIAFNFYQKFLSSPGDRWELIFNIILWGIVVINIIAWSKIIYGI